MEKLTHYLGGKFIESSSKAWEDARNPATGEVIYKYPVADENDIENAINAAQKGFEVWGKMSLSKRMDVLSEIKRIFALNEDNFVRIIREENGKTLKDAVGEFKRACSHLDFISSAPILLKGEFSANVGGDINTYNMREPLGVVVSVSSFNFPSTSPLSTSMAALFSGNAVIVKPSRNGVGCPGLIAKIFTEAGLPDGAWNVLYGHGNAVEKLLEAPEVKATVLMGSTRAGEAVYKKATSLGKRAMVFGSAKNEMVIMPDFDVEEAANAFVNGSYGVASQRCMAVAAALVVGDNGDEFAKKAAEAVAKIKAGDPDDPENLFGPVIDAKTRDELVRIVKESEKLGATTLVDGTGLVVKGKENGYFIGATLVDNVTEDMELFKEEFFGPVRIIVRVKSLDDAIAMINRHKYGNGCCIFTNNGYASRKFYQSVDVGMVGVNVPIPIPPEYHDFGGFKLSRIGDGQMTGPDSFRFFTRLKTVSEKWFPQEDR